MVRPEGPSGCSARAGTVREGGTESSERPHFGGHRGPGFFPEHSWDQISLRAVRQSASLMVRNMPMPLTSASLKAWLSPASVSPAEAGFPRCPKAERSSGNFRKLKWRKWKKQVPLIYMEGIGAFPPPRNSTPGFSGTVGHIWPTTAAQN